MREIFSGTKLHALEVGARTVVRRQRYLNQARNDPSPQFENMDIASAVAGLRKHGFYAVPGYFSLERCAQLRREIDRIVSEQPDIVHLDDARSDFRVHGAERASDEIRRFHDDGFCRGAGEAYFEASLGNLSTLAGRLTAKPGNLGSGQGWHRDALHFQYKALVYLSDVNAENGPFQLITGSHRPLSVLLDIIRGDLTTEPRDRIAPEQIAKILRGRADRLRTFTAAAGTLILFDSSTIHRGAPIEAGTRYALTNYYFPPSQMTDAMYAHFQPYARGNNPTVGAS